MKEIRKTSQFKKDYKRFKNDKEFVETLMGIVKLLAEGNQIPEEYNPHSLKGNWKNYMECHIENDTLLIWFDKNNNAIELVRLGSHSELFGKGRKHDPHNSQAVPSRKTWRRPLMVRQPYSVAVLSTGGRF